MIAFETYVLIFQVNMMKLKWLDHINGEWAEVPTQASTGIELFDRLLANQEIVVTPTQILYTKVSAVCASVLLLSHTCVQIQL